MIHNTSDDHVLEMHIVRMLHDDSDTFVNTDVSAVVRDGSGIVRIGDYSVTPSEARMLAASIAILANVAEPLPERVQP